MKEKLMNSTKLQYAAAASVLAIIMAVGFLAQSTGTLGSFGDSVQSSGAYDSPSDTLALEARSGGAAAESDTGSSPMFAISYNIDVKASKVRGAMDSTVKEVESLGGRVESENFDRQYGVNGNLNILVPEENASAFVSGIESGYRVESINRDKRDVSDSYTETSLELENKKKELQRLEELINETDEVSSLIDIQERMSDLRSRIQYLEQRKEDIEEDVNYVDVSISFEKPGAIDSDFDIRESIADAYNGVFNSFNLLIVGTGYLLPFALLAALLYGLKRLYSEQLS